MPLQSENLIISALGVKTEYKPASHLPEFYEDTILPKGMHLTWRFELKRGFPFFGYYLFRRPSRQPEYKQLLTLLNEHSVGSTGARNLDLLPGKLSSDTEIILRDNPDEPGLGIEFSRDEWLQFHWKHNNPVREVLVGIEFSNRTDVCIEIYAGNTLLERENRSGDVGDVFEKRFTFDRITRIKFLKSGAFIKKLNYIPVVDDFIFKNWELISGEEPICLPITHPEYPCHKGYFGPGPYDGTGLPENFDAARNTAKDRIRYYRNLEDFLPESDTIVDGIGTITIAKGKTIVEGMGTNWKSDFEDLTGKTFRIKSEPTTYAILKVIDDTHLELTRKYKGHIVEHTETHYTGSEYTITEDNFGKLYDYLIHLISDSIYEPPMYQRVLPEVRWNQGTVKTTAVTGAVTIDDVEHGKIVKGEGVEWLTLEPDPYNAKYIKTENHDSFNKIKKISSINGSRIIELEQPYLGPSGNNQKYFITEGFVSETEYGPAHKIPDYPLKILTDFLLEPAISQMLGLYWIDETAEEGQEYDYFIVAQHGSKNTITPTSPITSENLADQDFDQIIDGYIVFGRALENIEPQEEPADLKAYAQPPMPANRISTGEIPDSNKIYAAGLRWRIPDSAGSLYHTSGPFRYHVWRKDLGRPTSDPSVCLVNKDTPEWYAISWNLLTKKEDDKSKPVEVSSRTEDLRKFYYIDLRLSDGWYSYKVCAVDIFGRHSNLSKPSVWYQRPISLYKDLNGEIKNIPWFHDEQDNHKQTRLPESADPFPGSDYAIALLDKTGPPVPLGLKVQLIESESIRIKWKWTKKQEEQAPDLKEFRFYFKKGVFNVLHGNITSTEFDESERNWRIITDINDHGIGENELFDTELRIGRKGYLIKGNLSFSPLQLKVMDDPEHIDGHVRVENDSVTVKGTGTNWSDKLVGLTFKLADNENKFKILRVDSPTKLILNRQYYGEDGDYDYKIKGEIPVVDPPYSTGTVQIDHNSNEVNGTGVDWWEQMVGLKFKLEDFDQEYIIIAVTTHNTLYINNDYTGSSASSLNYQIYKKGLTCSIFWPRQHVYEKDMSLAKNWDERFLVVNHADDYEEVFEPIPVRQGKLEGNKAHVRANLVSFPDITEDDVNEIRLFNNFSLINPTDAGEASELYFNNARGIKAFKIINANNEERTIELSGEPDLPAADAIVTPWKIGQFMRQYNVLRNSNPSASTGSIEKNIADLFEKLKPSPTNPVVKGFFSVSAVDNILYTHDKIVSGYPGTISTYLGRTGNEGSLCSPFQVAWALEDIPVPPESIILDDENNIYATPADYHGNSYYTFRWNRGAANDNLSTHIYRALDAALFDRDWTIRTSRLGDGPDIEITKPIDEAYDSLNDHDWRVLSQLPGNEGVYKNGLIDKEKLKERDYLIRKTRSDYLLQHPEYFPPDIDLSDLSTIIPKSRRYIDAALRLNSISDREQYNAKYLQNSGMQILANLPGNELAFRQLTIKPIAHDDISSLNKVGPDDAEDFSVILNNYQPLSDPNLGFYLDTLPGKARNRYFYRSAYVNAAHTRGEMGLSTPPVWLPDILLPIRPNLLSVLGGERKVILKWAAHRESNMLQYLIYRSEDRNGTRDIRIMGAPVASIPAAPIFVVGGEIDFGAETDVVLVERVYDADGFDTNEDLISGQSAAQHLTAPLAPTGNRITGLSAPDNTPIVAVYRDSKQGLQYTCWGNKPRFWVDEGLVGAKTYYYRVVASRQGKNTMGSVQLTSLPSEVGGGRAIDLTSPDPPVITTIEWIRVNEDGIEFTFADLIPIGEIRYPAVRLRWTSPDPQLSCMVQWRSEPGGGFDNASHWLPRGIYEYVHKNESYFIVQEYRLKVLSLAGNANVNYEVVGLSPAV